MITPRAADMLTLSAQPAEARAALSLLGIAPHATVEEASRQYRQVVRDAHPDVHAGSALATAWTARVNAAWQIVRPLAEALERRRRSEGAAPVATGGSARVIPARHVCLGEPRVIPVPDVEPSLSTRGVA